MKLHGLLLLLACSGCIAQGSRRITGAYRNPALGYAVKIPPGLVGETGDQAGPERGIEISLPSGGTVVIFGEPNSLEWKTPEEGVEWSLEIQKCESGRQQDISTGRIGKLKAATGKLDCGGRVVETSLAFRPGGGPIYWITLRTSVERLSEDEAVLKKVAGTFRLIRWR